MGIIYAHPKNDQKDYHKSLECFQKLIKDYPASEYRQNSEMMIFYINNVAVKDKMIATQQTQIETLLQEVKSKENEVIALQKKIEARRKMARRRDAIWDIGIFWVPESILRELLTLIRGSG